ncbi:redoxin domain-containing protein [Sediminitomix flava]|uniref:Peroxiredoxin n=1 Tax=Sediminitomix flava TaxID=379075 RepID=A0A315Z022_SEDFL|nr:redoxin domain-containing protein [Sediminitomix flava]PWJ36043.1 peroxiredoxin [Sediminitomix flava]
MKSQIKRLTILLFISLFAFTSCKKGAPKPGEIAPDFKLSSVDGKEYILSAEKGKLVMVMFWTDNCDICKKEMPIVEKNYKDLKEQGFEILAVYVGESKTAPKEFKDKYGLTFPLLVGGLDVALDNYAVNATPTNFIVSPSGKVIRKIVGLVEKPQIEGFLYNIKRDAK